MSDLMGVAIVIELAAISIGLWRIRDVLNK